MARLSRSGAAGEALCGSLAVGDFVALGNKVLRSAVRKGDLVLTKAVLEAPHGHMLLHALSDKNETWLHMAAKRGHAKLVAYLADKGLPLDAVSCSRDSSALLMASRRGHEQAVAELLRRGASPHITDSKHDGPLFLAAWAGHAPVVSLLLEAGAPAHQPSLRQSSPLLTACSQGHESVVSVLLAAGADPLAANVRGYTALHHAVSHPGILRRLLRAVDAGDVDPRTHKGLKTPLMKACSKGHVRCVALLLEAGAQVNAASSKGTTPLMAACSMGRLEVVRLLLAQPGCELEACSPSRETALLQACRSPEHDEPELLRVLLQHGADLSQRTSRGSSPFHVLCRAGKLQCMAYMLKAFPHVAKESTANGTSPFGLCVQRGHVEAVKLLVHEAGADPNELCNGVPVLGWAARAGSIPCCMLLLGMGADINQKDVHKGLTPLQLAVLRDHLPVAKLLVSRGALIPPGRRHPIIVAAVAGSLSALAWLLDYLGEPPHQGMQLQGEQQQQEEEEEDKEEAEEKGLPPDQLPVCQQALLACCKSGRSEAAELLLQRGVRPPVLWPRVPLLLLLARACSQDILDTLLFADPLQARARRSLEASTWRGLTAADLAAQSQLPNCLHVAQHLRQLREEAVWPVLRGTWHARRHGWTKENHRWFPPEARRAVRTLLLHHARTRRSSPLGSLPKQVLLYILGFLTWWDPEQPQALPEAGQQQQQQQQQGQQQEDVEPP